MLVVWYPTGDMIEDYTTKMIQDAMLWKFMDQTMGVIMDTDTFPGKVKIEQLRKV